MPCHDSLALIPSLPYILPQSTPIPAYHTNLSSRHHAHHYAPSTRPLSIKRILWVKILLSAHCYPPITTLTQLSGLCFGAKNKLVRHCPHVIGWSPSQCIPHGNIIGTYIMKTVFTKRELDEMGVSIINDTAVIIGHTYTHRANDYQSGAGNHDDYRLFRLVSKPRQKHKVYTVINHMGGFNQVGAIYYRTTLNDEGVYHPSLPSALRYAIRTAQFQSQFDNGVCVHIIRRKRGVYRVTQQVNP